MWRVIALFAAVLTLAPPARASYGRNEMPPLHYSYRTRDTAFTPTNAATWQSVITTDLLTEGGPVMLVASGYVCNTAAADYANWTFFREAAPYVSATGVNLGNATSGLSGTMNRCQNNNCEVLTMTWVDRVPAGMYRYSLQVMPNDADANNRVVGKDDGTTMIFAMELTEHADQTANYVQTAFGNGTMNSNVFTDIPGASATLTTSGRPVLVLVSYNIEFNAGPGMYQAESTLTRGGTAVCVVGGCAHVSVWQDWSMPVVFAHLEEVPAGTYTWQVQIRRTSAVEVEWQGWSVNGQPGYIIAIEL